MVDQHHTMARSPDATAEIQNRTPPALYVSYHLPGLTLKIHGHLWIPSAPGVKVHSHRYILFPAQRVMHVKRIKIYHSMHEPCCGSNHARLSRNTGAWVYVDGGLLSFRASLAF